MNNERLTEIAILHFLNAKELYFFTLNEARLALSYCGDVKSAVAALGENLGEDFAEYVGTLRDDEPRAYSASFNLAENLLYASVNLIDWKAVARPIVEQAAEELEQAKRAERVARLDSIGMEGGENL